MFWVMSNDEQRLYSIGKFERKEETQKSEDKIGLDDQVYVIKAYTTTEEILRWGEYDTPQAMQVEWDNITAWIINHPNEIHIHPYL